MSADGSIAIVWGDGENTFRLAIGQMRELQESINRRRVAIGAAAVGPQTLLDLLRSKNAWPDDVRDILRIGLIGGGMKPPDAHRLMVNYFDNRPLMESMKPAFLVLMAALVGVPEEADGESKKKTATVPTKRRSSSAGSTVTAPH